jgi:hypothetical protein
MRRMRKKLMIEEKEVNDSRLGRRRWRRRSRG